MPKKSLKTVCIFTSVEGHRSIADAIQELLSDEYKVELFIERDESFDYYLPFYQFFPGIFKLPFTLAKQKQILKLLSRIFKEKYYDKVKAFCDEHQPDLCISTYFMYNSSLELISKEKNIPFINIITDPRTVHPMVISEKATVNVLFDDYQIDYCSTYVKDANYQTFGWIIRKKFEGEYEKNAVRKKIGLKPDVLTFLISSGSEGTNIVSKIFPSLMSASLPAQIIVACGNNKTLLKSVQLLSDVLKKSKNLTTLIPLGFTTEMQLYIQAADLVIGKAGPNTIFEAVAAEVPFFAITHISGQEDGNLDIIRDYNIGYVEENPFKAAKLISSIMKHPEQLGEFKENLHRLAKVNQNGKKDLRKFIDNLLQ